MNDSSAPGFDNGRNDSSRFPVCEISATDDCRWPFFFKNLLCTGETEREKEKYGWVEDETSESETWRYICLPLTNPEPDKKAEKLFCIYMWIYFSIFLSNFLNVWIASDKYCPAGVFHISIGLPVLYRMSGVEMKKEFFLERGIMTAPFARIFIYIHIYFFHLKVHRKRIYFLIYSSFDVIYIYYFFFFLIDCYRHFVSSNFKTYINIYIEQYLMMGLFKVIFIEMCLLKKISFIEYFCYKQQKNIYLKTYFYELLILLREFCICQGVCK